jgi:hypothetical protein
LSGRSQVNSNKGEGTIEAVRRERRQSGGMEYRPIRLSPQRNSGGKGEVCSAYAIPAPSSHNTQPWRFVVIDDELLVCADRSRSLAVIDPFDRELIISCGAALFNLRVVFSRFAVPVEVTTFPQSNDPDILARILFPRCGSIIPDLSQLFHAMKLRATNRSSFAEERK